MRFLASLPILLFALIGTVSAQFGFFEQMFNGGQQQQQQPQNVPSDSKRYQNTYEQSHCDKYLCPDTLGTSEAPRCVSQGPEHKLTFVINSLRTLPTPLPLRVALTRRQVRAGRGAEDMCV